jgi:hypothetical protein
VRGPLSLTTTNWVAVACCLLLAAGFRQELTMPATQDDKGDDLIAAMDAKKAAKLGLVSGVYIPVCLNIMSILMFLRFGLILGQVGFSGILGIYSTPLAAWPVNTSFC